MRNLKALRSFGPLTLIHEQAGPELLRLTRLSIFGLWFVKLLLDPVWRLTELPRQLFSPIGLLRLLSPHLLEELLTGKVLAAWWGLTLIVLAASGTRRFFPLASALGAVLLTFYSALSRSFGPAVHTDTILLLAVYVLALFSWADWLQVRWPLRRPADGPHAADGWSSYPLITIAALLTLSYTMVGVNRVVAGGTRIFTGDTMEGWVVDAALRGYFYNTDIGWHVPQWPAVLLLLKLGLVVITLFEITAPICLFSPHYRWVFIPTMLLFHLLSLIFMNILFYEDMLLYLLLVDWSRKFRYLQATAD